MGFAKQSLWCGIAHALKDLQRGQEQTVGDLTKLQGDVVALQKVADTVGPAFATLRTQITALQATVAAGGNPQADIDAIDNTVTGVETELGLDVTPAPPAGA